MPSRTGGEVFRATLGPLELHVPETGYLRVSLVYALTALDFAAEGAVIPCLNEDAPAQAELTEGTLPEHDRPRSAMGANCRSQNNLILSHETILSSYTSKACNF